MGRTLRRQRPGVVVLVVLALVMSTLAVLHRGIPAARVSLNDGGVWVTNAALRLVGHLNYPSRTLDGGLRAGSADFDLSQHGNAVLVHDYGAAGVQNVDTALVTLGQAAPLTETREIRQGGDTAAILDRGVGKLWIMPAADVGSFSPEAEPIQSDLLGARVVVAVDGTVLVVAADGAVTAHRGGKADSVGHIEGITDLTAADLTAVGDQVVVLDKAAPALRTTRGSAQLKGAERVRVQQPGPAADAVAVALPDGYAFVPLAGGTFDTIPLGAAAGMPAPPAVVAGCTYLAWGGSGVYVRDCEGDADDVRQEVDRIRSASALSFRVNRDVVVLNDMVNGTVFLVNDDMRAIDDWKPVDTQVTEQEDHDDEASEEVTELSGEVRKELQTTPVAVDDEFGARPGRTVTLPVLANDSDPDGDLLTAVVGTPPTGGATVAPVRGGEALALTVPDDASGRITFTYFAEDGRDGRDEATVTVTIATPDQNGPPAPLRPSTLTLGQRAEGSTAVLGDWIDPEGDALYLESVAGVPGLEAHGRADGRVTVKDLGTGGPGPKDVAVFVRDGVNTAEGVLRVNVLGDANVPPVANTDHVTVLKDQQVVIRPLANDTDPNGDELRLADVTGYAAHHTVRPDFAAGSFVFSSSIAETAYVEYQVTDGPTSVTGWVRIDVVEPAEVGPVAADDIAILPAGGSVVVDVLANDTDPTGGVLVLQGVQVEESARSIAAEILDHGALRVSSPTGLTVPQTFTYTAANALGAATGTVTLVPLPAVSTADAPVAQDDRGLVRVGDIVTIPVLANDSSPAGLRLDLDPTVTVEEQGAGDAFVSRNQVRFRATQPGTVRLGYTVRDSAGNFDSAEAVVTVVALESANQPPQPQPLVGRVLSGGTVTIPVPTDGTDPDGDTVTLVGIASAPGKGNALATPAGIEYTAAADAVGTDSFSYEVVDRFGARASASLRVGIAPANTTNQSPVAVPDDVSTRPGRSISVNVVANDVDPDGDALSLVAGSVTPVDDKTDVPASEDGRLVEVTAPGAETMLQYYYDVTDGRGGTARGVATVRVSEDAVLRSPVARDDAVSLAEVRDKTSVEVDVLANDHDPDGTVSALQLGVEDSGASVTGRTITVPVTGERQVILYTLTDQDGLTGRAAIVVPAAEAVPPTINPNNARARVKAGELLTIALADHVLVRANRQPRITFANTVVAGPGADTTELVKDERTLQFRTDDQFVGPSSITFEVTDGATPEDPTGIKALLTLPIDVESSGLHPPTFRPSDVTVAAGEDPKTVNLREMVTDDDPGDLDRLQFSLGSRPAGFDVALNGSTLSVGAPRTAAPGASATLEVTVTDGSTEPISATVGIRVTASTRPLMVASPVAINDANAGQATTVNLADHVTNPFAAEGVPVELVGLPQATVGQATVSANGLSVTITPSADFNGQIVVPYVVQDATKDPNRQVNGTITLTVRARPDAPTGVTAETRASRTATVSWTAGANNGAPISGFSVRWSGGSKDCGAVTTCTVDSLTNNVTYTFTVTATNAVGESDPSAPSNEVRPDVKPDPPGTPQGTFGDKQVDLTWAAATTEGSPVTSYTVRISPAAGGVTEKPGITGTSYTWTGLTNGTAYTFAVQAHSSAEQPSDWSGTSSPVVPAGPPAQPAAPRVTKNPVSALEPSATISWTAPAANGDANITYQLRRTGDTAVLYEGTGLSANVTMDVSTSDQTFEVKATNKAGDSPWSPPSNAERGFKVPGAVGNLTITPTGADNTATVSYTAAAGNGALPSEMQYFWSVGSTTGSLGATGGTITHGVLVDGQNVSVSVYAVSVVKGERAQGPATAATVNTYGPPVSPSMSCGVDGTAITCSWSGGDANGRATTFNLSGDASGAVGASGSHPFGDVGYSATRTLCVQATQEGGRQGARNCDSKTTVAPPPPSISRVSVSGLTVTVNFTNWSTPGSREIRCWNSATWEGRSWPNAGAGTAGNFLGTAGYHEIPVNGRLTFTCAGNELNGAMRPDGNFAIELVGNTWWHLGV